MRAASISSTVSAQSINRRMVITTCRKRVTQLLHSLEQLCFRIHDRGSLDISVKDLVRILNQEHIRVVLLPFDQLPRHHLGCEADAPVDRDHDDQLLLARRLHLQVLRGDGKLPLSVVSHRRQREGVGLVPSVGSRCSDAPGLQGTPFSGTRSRSGRAGRAGGQPGRLSDSSGQTACSAVATSVTTASATNGGNAHDRRIRNPLLAGCALGVARRVFCAVTPFESDGGRQRPEPGRSHPSRAKPLCDEETRVDFWPARLTRCTPPAAPGTLKGSRPLLPRQQNPAGPPSGDPSHSETAGSLPARNASSIIGPPPHPTEANRPVAESTEATT